VSKPPKLADIPVWLINLDRSSARRAAMEHRCTEIGLDYQRFAAIDGPALWDTLAKTVDVPAFQRATGRHVMPPEIGCTHSHLGVWEHVIDSGAPAGLVLEDDVVFHPNFLEAVDTALAHMDHWDVLKLNTIRAKWPRARATVGTFKLCAYFGSFTGMGAYLITRTAAQQLLPRMTPITRPIDHELDRSWRHHIRHYGLVPYPSYVSDGNQSTITGQGFAGVKKFPKWQRLPAYAQRARNLFFKGIEVSLPPRPPRSGAE